MKKTIGLILILVILTSFVSCGKKSDPKSRVFYGYFDTVCTVYDYTGGTERQFASFCEDVEGRIKEYHELLDIYNTYAGVVNLASVNSADCAVSVDERLFDFLAYAKQMHALTDGEINIAFGSVLSVWHKYREEGTGIPSNLELSIANEHTDIENIILDYENKTVKRADKQLKIDAGALGKGYACEMIGEYIREKYGEGYVLDFGGNLKTVGSKPDGTGWKTGIKNPNEFSSEPFSYVFEIKNESVVTSGINERFYTVSGVRYHHIIDKDTLMPKNDYASVTVRAESAALCDALSTALFNMEKQEIETLLSKISGVKVILIYPDGKILELSSLK